ncbi:MAG: hypothetical protein PF483_12220 [Halothiobacillus sp.]|jgi:purine-cytosine permease-like protein|nr:hypothetical protein [Halothiobacillus sp.]
MSSKLGTDNDSPAVIDAKARAGNDDDQMSRLRLMMAWFGVSSAFFYVYVAASLTEAYGSINTFIGLGLTILAYGAINAVLSPYAINNRTTVAEFSRTTLGTRGSVIAIIVFALIAIYYAVFEGSILAYAMSQEFGLSMPISNLIVVAYTAPLVPGGARHFLDKVNGFLLPIYVLGLIAACVWATIAYGYSGAWVAFSPATSLTLGSGGPGWLAAFSGYMGVWILMMFTMDFAALGRRRDIKFHRHISFGVPFYLLLFGFSGIVGIFLDFNIPNVQASESGIVGGLVSYMGIFAVILVFATQTRINTANYYLGSSNLQAFFKRLNLNLPYWFWVVITAITVYLIMLLPITQYVLTALVWQGVFVTAWVAIALTHALLVKTEGEEHGAIDDKHYRAFNKNGLLAWAVAIVVGLIMLQFGHIDPTLAGIGRTWGPIATAMLASLIYAVMWVVNPADRTALIKSPTRRIDDLNS